MTVQQLCSWFGKDKHGAGVVEGILGHISTFFLTFFRGRAYDGDAVHFND
jgi:hypothetical protein